MFRVPTPPASILRFSAASVSRFLHDRRVIQTRNGITRWEATLVTGCVFALVGAYLALPIG